jgi:hypothetical protein
MMANCASIPILVMGTISLTINGVSVHLINCYHTPGLRASLYSLRRHRRSPRCAFLGEQQGMYLTFGKIYTRVQDDVDCWIQLRPLTPQHNLKYAINHTLEPVPSIAASPSAMTPNTAYPPSFTYQPCHLSRTITEIYCTHSIGAPHFSILCANPPSYPSTFIVPTFSTAETQLQRLTSHGLFSDSPPH